MGLLEINCREIIAKLFYGIYLWDTPDHASKKAKLAGLKKQYSSRYSLIGLGWSKKRINWSTNDCVWL